MRTKNPFEPRAVVSRRGGRVKKPLSLELIVSTALELLRREGSDAMSLRRVAAALDTGPASLYVYVDDVLELEALVLDRALAGVRVTAKPTSAWRRRLTALLESYFQVLFGTPGLARLAMRRIAAGPNALRMVEAMLGLLDEAGLDGPTAAWAVDLLTLYVTAIAAEQTERVGELDPLGPIAAVLRTVKATEHPRVHRLRDELVSGCGDQRFAWALDVLLTGLAQTPARKR
jgi:AcrR family transcriptional regulator